MLISHPLPLPPVSVPLMLTTNFSCTDERGFGLIEAMFSIAILAIAALAIGAILIGSFRQTTTAEQVLNAQLYGMATGVAGTYSSATNVTLNVSIDPGSTAQNTSVPDAVSVTALAPSAMTSSIATAPVASSTNTPDWWLP